MDFHCIVSWSRKYHGIDKKRYPQTVWARPRVILPCRRARSATALGLRRTTTTRATTTTTTTVTTPQLGKLNYYPCQCYHPSATTQALRFPNRGNRTTTCATPQVSCVPPLALRMVSGEMCACDNLTLFTFTQTKSSEVHNFLGIVWVLQIFLIVLIS